MHPSRGVAGSTNRSTPRPTPGRRRDSRQSARSRRSADMRRARLSPERSAPGFLPGAARPLGLLLEVSDLLGLFLDAALGAVELFLLLALPLFPRALTSQRGIAREVAGRLLGPAGQLVDEAHRITSLARFYPSATDANDSRPAGTRGPHVQARVSSRRAGWRARSRRSSALARG